MTRTAAWEAEVTADEGVRTNDPTQAQALLAQGYTKCPNPKCNFYFNVQAKSAIEQAGGYFTCPACNRSNDLMQELPWHGVGHGPWDNEHQQGPGGQTIIGLPLADHAQIGENVVAKLGEIPGYGPIVWWHPGGATTPSPLDGATKEWGIEVKTIAYDAAHHRFVPGRTQEKDDKNQQAAEMGLKGILGILVLLDYRRDLADVYVKEMPLAPWQYAPGRYANGVAALRKNTAQRLVAEVPFESPYKDPSNPSPQTHDLSEFYQKPQPIDVQPPAEGMPF